MKLSEIFFFDFKQAHGSAVDREAIVKTLFESGLQEILSVLIGLTAADLKQTREIPPGFCGRLSKALSSPVLGTMLDFLTWVHKNADSNGVPQFRTHMLKAEDKNAGWLKKMVGLRNKFYHPKDEKVEDILSRAFETLDTVPDFDSWGWFERSGENCLLWTDNNGSFPLEPFLFLEGDSVCFPKEFVVNRQITYSCGSARFVSEFSQWWKEARIRDRELDDPTREDFYGKARMMAKEYHQLDPPEWFNEIFTNKHLGYIVEPGILGGVLGNLRHKWPQAIGIEIPGKGHGDLMQSIASMLGFKKKPSISDLSAWISKNSPCVIGIRTDQAKARDFLKYISWLLDLKETGAREGLRVVIERNQVQIENDMEKLWDRLPENLGEILNAPKHKARDLKEFVWDQKQKRGIRKLFRKLF